MAAGNQTPPPPTAQATTPRRPSQVRRLATRAYRVTRGALALAMLLEVLLVCTPLTETLLGGLVVTEPAAPADVIVCLGGDLSRVAIAADLFHRGFAPRVAVTHLPGAAEEWGNLLVEWGVPADRVLVDATSRTTADHPSGVARLPGIDPATQRFILVTDLEHSRRAVACFRHAGYRHVSVYGGPPGLPGSGGGSDTTLHAFRWRLQHLPHIVCEYAALAKYWVCGLI